jgi:hypothetical protein
MNDRLQRRLRDADPLTATTGSIPDPARLDAIREHIMDTNDVGLRSAIRPRALAGAGLAAVALAGILVGASLLRPSATILAWSAAPTPVTAGQKAAAATACEAGLPTIAGPGEPAGGTVVNGAGGAGPTSVEAGGAGSGSGPSHVTTGIGSIPAPTIPTELPPLVSLELHGSGGIAVFADDTTTAYCLLVQQGDGFRMGGLLIPSVNGATIGVAGIGQAGDGPASGAIGGGQSIGAIAGDGNGLQVTAMAMTFEGTSLGIIAGVAPDGATSVTVHGGPADGASATVNDGRFALWAPGVLGSTPVQVTAVDASGTQVARQTLFSAPPPGGPGFVTNSTAP